MAYSRQAGWQPIRHVQRVRRLLSDGRCNYHYYHRQTRTKLPGLPGSPEFLAAYEEAERRVASQQQAKPPAEQSFERDRDFVGNIQDRDHRFFAEYGWRHG
jgi:hypothetical protein